MELLRVLFSFVILHVSYVLLGLAFVFIPFTHKLGLRFLAMSIFPRLCGKYCRLACPGTKCGNWTCPYYTEEGRACKR